MLKKMDKKWILAFWILAFWILDNLIGICDKVYGYIVVTSWNESEGSIAWLMDLKKHVNSIVVNQQNLVVKIYISIYIQIGYV